MSLTAPRSTSSGYNTLYLSLLVNLQSECSSVIAPHYDTAIQSLQRCPVPHRSIDALMQLEGFSAGIKRKLAVIVREGGGEEAMDKQRRDEVRRKKGRRSLVECLEEEERRADAQVQQPASERAQEEQVEQAPNTTHTATKRKSKPAQPPKQYIPTERSGAWGLLVGLYLLSAEDDADATTDSAYYTKDALIAKAQKYSRASYSYCPTRSAGGAKFVTAWGSMKILLKRELVWQRGRPMTFGLSEAGWEVARKCAAGEGLCEDGEQGEGDAVRAEDAQVDEQENTPAVNQPQRMRPPTLLQLLEKTENTVPQAAHTEERDPTPPPAPRIQLVLPPKPTTKRLYLPEKTSATGVSVLRQTSVSNVDRTASILRPTPPSNATSRTRTLPTLFLPTKTPRSMPSTATTQSKNKENAVPAPVPVEVIVIDD